MRWVPCCILCRLSRVALRFTFVFTLRFTLHAALYATFRIALLRYVSRSGTFNNVPVQRVSVLTGRWCSCTRVTLSIYQLRGSTAIAHTYGAGRLQLLIVGYIAKSGVELFEPTAVLSQIKR